VQPHRWLISRRESGSLPDGDRQPALKEPPDGSATVKNPDGTTLLLDFEIAEYYVDDPGNGDGGSPSKRTSGVWEKVRAALDPRLEALRLPVDVAVRLREPILLRPGDIPEFVDELIRFAQQFCPAGHLDRTTHDRFPAASYSALRKHVEQVSLTRLDGVAVMAWRCSNVAAACVGVVAPHLSHLVRRKSGKNFTWVPGAKRCLLIYASGETVTSRGGPPPPDPSIWGDADLVAACVGSVFNRIYFWERVRKWVQRLK
jgi:hypothetical protein